MTLDALIDATRSLSGPDAFAPRFSADQWRNFAQYLTQHDVRGGDLLIKQGDADRTMYLLESGTLQVYANDVAPGARIALVRPGSIAGEIGLFVDGPRSANVEAMGPCEVWALRLPRLEELAQRLPALALEVLRAAGAVMARRMRSGPAVHAPAATR